MRLLNSILTTLIVGMASSLIMAIYIASQSAFADEGLYSFVMIFGNMIMPIFLTVCIFSVLGKKTGSAKWPVRYIAQVLFVLIIMAIGIFLMTISMSISYYGGLAGLAPGNLSREFDDSYKGWIPDIILDSLLIPGIYYWVSKVIHKKVASWDKEGSKPLH